MPSRNALSVPRYIAFVTLVYLIAFGAMLAYTGAFGPGWDQRLFELWPLALGAVVMAILGTLVPIARFGAAGGSIFFVPTTIHAFILIAMVTAALTTKP